MRRKGRIVGGVIVLSIALLPVTVFAFGIGVDLPVYTLDLSASLAKVPVAVADSLDALGISGTDAASIRADMNTALAQIEADFPSPRCRSRSSAGRSSAASRSSS